MKALTLHQPWASLVALGVKRIETRSWSTSYRGALAIHAGLKRPGMMYLPERPSLRHWLVANTITAPEHQRPHRTDIRDRVPAWATTPTLFSPAVGPHGERYATMHLPLGAVVATCELVDVLPIRDSMGSDTSGDYVIVGDEVGLGFIGGNDFGMLDQVPYGDFTPGRFAWLLAVNCARWIGRRLAEVLW